MHLKQFKPFFFSFKICYPHTIYFLRGNHECRQMTSFFNFREECLYKYDQQIYDTFMDSFDLLPVSCLVNGKFLALHGGISPDLKTVIKSYDEFFFETFFISLMILKNSIGLKNLQDKAYFGMYFCLLLFSLKFTLCFLNYVNIRT